MSIQFIASADVSDTDIHVSGTNISGATSETDRHPNSHLIKLSFHWILLATFGYKEPCLQDADSLTAMLKSLVTANTFPQGAVFFSFLCSLEAGPSVSHMQDAYQKKE